MLQRMSQRTDWRVNGALILTVLGGFVAIGVMYVFPRIPIGQSATVSMVGEAEPGVNVIVSVNGKGAGRIALSPNQGEQSVRVDSQSIEALQLRFEGNPGTRLNLSEFTIAYGSKVVIKQGGIQFSQMVGKDLTGLRFSADGLKARMVTGTASLEYTPQPALVSPGPIDAIQYWLISATSAPETLNLWVIVFILGLAVSIVGVRRRALLAAALGLCVWVLAIASYELVPLVINPDPSVATAVGGASYFGTSYTGQHIATFVSLMLVLVGAAALSAVKYKKDQRKKTRIVQHSMRSVNVVSDKRIRQLSAPASVSRAGTIILVGWFAVALTLVPALGLGTDGWDAPAANWDVGNLIVWDYFREVGLVPMQDYWFPYGNRWLFFQFPYGPAWEWLAQITMLAILAWSLWRLCQRSPIRIVICLFAVAAIGSLGVNVWRYLPTLLVGTTFAALGPVRNWRPNWGHLIFFGTCFLTLLIEADLLLFGLASAGLVLIGDILFGSFKTRPSRLLVRTLVDAVPVAGAIVLIFLVWLAWGVAQDNLDLFLHLNDVAAYSAPNQAQGVLANLSFTPNANTLLVVLPILMLFAGVVQGFLGKQSASYGVSRLLFAAAGPSLVLVSRSIVRWNDDVILVSLIALTCAAILLWNRRNLFAAAVTGVFMGAVFAAAVTGVFPGAVFIGLQQSGGLQKYVSGIGETPIRVADSAIYLTHQEEIRIGREQAFAPQRFRDWPEARIADQLRKVAESQNPSFAVLGDAPLMYMLIGQRPPIHVTLYSAAPIYEQRKMIASIRRDKPKYIVWRRDSAQIDAVPYVVRDPLLFTYVIGHYVPVKLIRGTCSTSIPSCGSSDILSVRKTGKPIPVNYWRSRLGTTLDLGAIPSYAKLPGRQSCSGDKECVKYAVIQGHPTNSGQPIEFEISGRGKNYRVIFNSSSSTNHYTIRLDRLWFWQLLGSRPRLKMLTAGLSLKQLEAPEDGRLY